MDLVIKLNGDIDLIQIVVTMLFETLVPVQNLRVEMVFLQAGLHL